jgi:hypothetical protein
VYKTAEIKKFILHEDLLKIVQAPSESSAFESGKKSFVKNLLHSVENPFEFMTRTKSLSQAWSEFVTPANDTPVTSSSVDSNKPFMLTTKFLSTGRSPELDTPDSEILSAGWNFPVSLPVSPSYAGSVGGNSISPGITLRDSTQSISATDAAIDLFIELFELREKNNWLRRQAVVILLQQLFGGTVERRVTDALLSFAQIDSAIFLIEWTRDYFWPEGKPFFETEHPERTLEQKKKTRSDSLNKMTHLFPEILGSMVGRLNAKRGAERLCDVFQNRRLNQQLLYVLLDELLDAVFPELRGHPH